MDSLDGGMYRWRHGLAVQLLPDDTMEALSAPHNDIETILSAACAGYRQERPLMEWDSYAVATIAEACGI